MRIPSTFKILYCQLLRRDVLPIKYVYIKSDVILNMSRLNKIGSARLFKGVSL